MKSLFLLASFATLLSFGLGQKQTLPIKVLRCYECNAQTNAGDAANCHLDESDPGSLITCQDDDVCYKEILENNKGEVTYERGCIKRPVDFQEDEPCNEEVDVNGRKVKKCFCTDSKCNSVAQIAPMLASIAFGLAFLKIVF